MSDSGSSSALDAFGADEQTGYSPEKWYTRATNSKGFDKSLKVVAVPPELMGAIEALVQDTRVPLRTKADAFRDALVHWANLRQHQLRNPDFGKKASVFVRLMEAERMRAEGSATRDLIKTREDHLASERDPAIVGAIVEEMKKDLVAIESAYYRSELQRVIDRYDR